MISIIICTYNREQYIYQCLERLIKNTCQTGWEIVLVNNNSTDGTTAECERFVADYQPTNYHYFVETQQGLSYARNRGIAEAKGDWLVFLDDDAFVETNYIERLQAQLLEHQDAGAFGGQITPLFEDGEPAWLNPWAMGFVSAINKGEHACLFGRKEYPIGANMGIARSVIDRVGDFNTALGRTGNNLMGGEEKDIFGRIREAGFPIYYFPGIGVQHCIPARRTTREFIARLGEGVGMSERARTKGAGQQKYLLRLFAEGIKWGGTIVLWCRYSISGVRAKGDILVLFRRNVTKGLLSCK